MAQNPIRIRSSLPEGGHPRTLAQIVDADGSAITLSDITSGNGGSISYTAYDEQAADPTTPVVATTAITPADVVATVTGPDGLSYNLDHKATDAEICAEGGHTYRIEYEIVLDDTAGNDNDPIWVVHRVATVQVQAG